MLQKNNINKIMEIIFENPTKRFQLRELARISKISTTGVKSVVNELIRLEIIIKAKEKNYEYYEANRDNNKYKNFKKFYNINVIDEIGLIIYLEKELNYPEAVFLFGSTARGEDVEASDIDIFVLSSKKKEIDLDKYKKLLRRDIRLIIMNKDDFEKAKEKNPELINNIVNGINLKGFLEVV